MMSIGFKSSLTLVAAALTSAVLLSSTAVAAPNEPVVVTATRDVEHETRTVSYRDLNLAQAHDQRRLDWRVSSAIKDVCGLDEYHAVRTLVSYDGYRRCSRVAWNGARPQIAAAISRAQAFAALGGRGTAVAGTAITISARVGG